MAITQWPSLAHTFKSAPIVERFGIWSLEDAERRLRGIGKFFESIPRGLPSWKRLGYFDRHVGLDGNTGETRLMRRMLVLAGRRCRRGCEVSKGRVNGGMVAAAGRRPDGK